QRPERECVQRHPDDDPQSLLERVRVAEPVDLRQPDRSQEGRDRQQVGGGVRDGDARDEVRDQIEREEEDRVCERAPVHLGLTCDVDRREADTGQRPDDRQVEKLPVAVAESQRASPHQTSTTISAISPKMTSSASNRLPSPAWGTSSWASWASSASCAASAAPISSAGTTIVSTASGTSGGGRTPSSGCRVSSSSGEMTISRVRSSGSPRSPPSPSSTANRTAVMLSSPPPRFAAWISAFDATARSARFRRRISSMSPNSTIDESPSLQIRKMSPGCASTEKVSTSTSGSVPSARVITERCGDISAL